MPAALATTQVVAAAALAGVLAPAPAAAQEPAAPAGFFASAASNSSTRAAPASPSSWQLSPRSDHHSDALPLAVLGDDDWQRLAPRPGRNLAYLDDEVRLQGRSGDWTWGLLARSLATVVASRDTLALAQTVDAGVPPASNTRWLPAVHWQQPVGEATLGLGWRVHERRLTVALDWRGLTLRAGADRLDAAARTRELALAYGHSF